MKILQNVKTPNRSVYLSSVIATFNDITSAFLPDLNVFANFYYDGSISAYLSEYEIGFPLK